MWLQRTKLQIYFNIALALIYATYLSFCCRLLTGEVFSTTTWGKITHGFLFVCFCFLFWICVYKRNRKFIDAILSSVSHAANIKVKSNKVSLLLYQITCSLFLKTQRNCGNNFFFRHHLFEISNTFSTCWSFLFLFHCSGLYLISKDQDGLYRLSGWTDTWWEHSLNNFCGWNYHTKATTYFFAK